jgi:hypothetical protein
MTPGAGLLSMACVHKLADQGKAGTKVRWHPGVTRETSGPAVTREAPGPASAAVPVTGTPTSPARIARIAGTLTSALNRG